MMIRNVEKKEWIKTSFWAPENTPDSRPESKLKELSKGKDA